MSFRPVKSETLATSTMKGAGVQLHRAFGFHKPREFDPFLLFDDFRGDHPSQFTYRAFQRCSCCFVLAHAPRAKFTMGPHDACYSRQS